MCDMLSSKADVQYDSSVSSFEDELLENIRPNLISLTLSGSFSSHFDSDIKSLNGDEFLNNNKDVNTSLDSFTVILNPNANDEAAELSDKDNSIYSSMASNDYQEHIENKRFESKSQFLSKRHLLRNKKWKSLHDLSQVRTCNSKVALASGPSQSTTTVCSVTKSKDSGLTKTPSGLSLLGGNKCSGDFESRFNATLKDEGFLPISNEKYQNNNMNELVDVLQKELKLKDSIIEQIQQNYLELLKKYAEAENKIDKLRIKVIHPSSEELPTEKPPHNHSTPNVQCSYPNLLNNNERNDKNKGSCLCIGNCNCTEAHESLRCTHGEKYKISTYSHPMAASSTPVLSEHNELKNEIKYVADITENSILKVKRWQKSLPSFNPREHNFDAAATMTHDPASNVEQVSGIKYNSPQNYAQNLLYIPHCRLDFNRETKRQKSASNSLSSSQRRNKSGSIFCSKNRHPNKFCTEMCSSRIQTQLQPVEIEACSCWSVEDLNSKSDLEESSHSCCRVPRLELNSSMCSDHHSSEENNSSQQMTNVSDALTDMSSSNSQHILLNTKDPHTVSYSKYKKPVPKSDTSTSYHSIKRSKAPEAASYDDCDKKVIATNVKKALLDLLLNDSICSHESTKPVETHSCGINTDSSVHEKPSTECNYVRNKDSVDLEQCLEEVNKIANLLKSQSENIVKEITKHMRTQLS